MKWPIELIHEQVLEVARRGWKIIERRNSELNEVVDYLLVIEYSAYDEEWGDWEPTSKPLRIWSSADDFRSLCEQGRSLVEAGLLEPTRVLPRIPTIKFFIPDHQKEVLLTRNIGRFEQDSAWWPIKDLGDGAVSLSPPGLSSYNDWSAYFQDP